MANKNWLLLIAAICLVIADKFNTTDARSQRIRSIGKNQLIRFQPINHKQYESIMKLTSGQPIISEDRLMNSEFRSLSSISQIVSDDLTNRFRVLLNMTRILLANETNSVNTNRYPLCVINVADLANSNRAGERSYSSESVSTSLNINANSNNNAQANNPQTNNAQTNTAQTNADDSNDSSKVKCVVVVSTPDSTKRADNNKPVDYCVANPLATGCCNPRTDEDCPGFCRYNRWDPSCDDMDCRGRNTSPECRMRHRYRYPSRRRYTIYPDYSRFEYPYDVPPYDYRYGYAPETSRARPTEVMPKQQNIGKFDNTAYTAPSSARKNAVHKKHFNKPAVLEVTSDFLPSAKETTRAGYDNTQIYQQLYNAGYGQAQAQATYGGVPQAQAAYGGLPQAQVQAAYGGVPQAQVQTAYGGYPQAQATYAYSPYANYQFNPYAGVPNGQNLRFPAQYQQQVQMPYGNYANYAVQNKNEEDSSGEDSGEYSGEEENYDARSITADVSEWRKESS